MAGFWKPKNCFKLGLAEMAKGSDAILCGDDPMPFLAMYLAQIPRFIIDSLLLIALVLFAAFYSTQEISGNSFLMNISIYGVAGLKLLPAFQNIFYFASEIQARSKYLNNITPLINKITTQERFKLLENN